MEHSLKTKILVSLGLLAIGTCWTGTSVFAAYDAATNTDTLTNQMVSPTRGDLNKGDLHSYDHADRNLVINWDAQNGRSDGSAIRDASVNAKNITINADFDDPADWVNKAIISSQGDSHVIASGNINIKSFNDAVYTENTAKTTIEGFKNLTIRASGNENETDDNDIPVGGFGVTDNGGGITIKGGADSTVDISATLRPAIGNSLWSAYGIKLVGTGITIDAGKRIILTSPEGGAVFSGMNKDNNFKVTLNAPAVELNGGITTTGGSVFVDDNQYGDVTINCSDTDESAQSIVAYGDMSKVSINEKKGGMAKITGGIESNSATVLINMTGNGSFINTKGDEKDDWAIFKRKAIESNNGANVTVNTSGSDSFIRGDLEADNGTINVNASGKRFTLNRSYDYFPAPYLITSKQKDARINVDISGDDSKVEGKIRAYSGGTLNLTMSGNHAVYSGGISTTPEYESWYNPRNDKANVHAIFSGKDASVTGDIEAIADHGTITTEISGENSTYKGNVSSIGAMIGHSENNSPMVYTIYDGAAVNLTLDGAHTSQTGNLSAEGNNILNASYIGTGSSLTGDADNKGLMNLTFDNQSQMTGNMVNDTKKYEDHKGTIFAGQLKANFNNGSIWTGDLTNTSGTTNVGFNNGSFWSGNLSSTAGTTTINLNNGSAWTGASTGNGDITLTNGSLWALTKDSTANSVNPDGSSVVSLAGAAKKLEVQKLGGTGGTFRMDLDYKDNDVNTYRNGGGDFIVAHGGNGSSYNVGLTPDSSVSSMTDGSKLYFASTAAGSSAFQMDQAVQLQNYKKLYNKNLIVKKETDTTVTDLTGYDDWFLTPDGSKGNGGNTINPNGIVPGAATSTALALWRDDDTLLKRLGELRYNESTDGLWARMVNKQLSRDGAHGFKGNYKTLQVGYDWKRPTAKNGDWYYGAAISHLWGDTDYRTNGHGSQKSTDLSLYGTNIRPHGHYLDLIARVGRIDSDYTSSYSDHGKFENWGTSLGAEYGRKKDFGHGWTLEPQAQLTYHYLWGDDYITKNGARVSQDNADSLVGRLGFVVANEFNQGTPHAGRVYLKASVLHDFLGSTGNTLVDDIRYRDDDDLGDTWYVAGIGTDLHFGKDTQFYFDAERNFNADVRMKYRFNVGLRFGF